MRVFAGQRAWLLQRATALALLLDLLMRLRSGDDSLSFRRSCREGGCGSDAMNINGRHGLACMTALAGLKEPVVLHPLPGFPVVRDLVVDMTQFFAHYNAIKPYLINDEVPPERERLQSPEQRERLNGLYEWILCACCSAFCPSYWWNPDKFIGPAGLLQACRFIVDSRDTATTERLACLDDVYRLYRCRTIMNCTAVCPKGLSPSHAIEQIRLALVRSARAGAFIVMSASSAPRGCARSLRAVLPTPRHTEVESRRTMPRQTTVLPCPRPTRR